MNNSEQVSRYRYPSGTVTFLFTDIEGSSSLAQEYPGDIQRLLERHHTILRESIETCKGVIFLIVGDAFCAAFHSASEALRAALQAQRRLTQEDWQPAAIKVRMGIHTGTAEYVPDKRLGSEYDGYLTLTRVQRVMSSAHGGQVLLSGASAELLRGSLPEGAGLRDLGEHRLKGLAHAEHLWQLTAPDLPADFPELLSYNAIPNNLPIPATEMIGRQAELAEVVRRLSSPVLLAPPVHLAPPGTRLLTLTGPGGIGKTRMSLQAGFELIDSFPQGVYFIDLAPVREAELVATAIVRTLGLKETDDRPALEEIKAQLRDKSMLLILDNFEQVTAAAPRVAELMQACPQLKLLVTSREALRVRGEQVFPIPPLPVPPVVQAGGGGRAASLEQLNQYEAVRLFIERAQAARADFEVTNENAPAVAEICVQLDGLPLAIELAAARLRLFTPQALLERLGDRLSLLRGGARDLPERQQTLRHAIDWSYDLLVPGEQRLFELCAAFPGGGTFEAIEAVAGWPGIGEKLAGVEAIDGLDSLVEKSLLRQVESGDGEARLLMLGTIREYGREKLGEDEAFCAAVERAHAGYFAEYTQRQWDNLRQAGGASLPGEKSRKGRQATSETPLDNLAAELENIRLARNYWANQNDLEQMGRFVDGLWQLYNRRGWYHSMVEMVREMLEVLSRLDALSSQPPSPERVQQEIVLQTSLARALQVTKGYTAEVEQAYLRALELSESVGETPELFPALRGLGSLYGYIGRYDKAQEISWKILRMAERLGDENMQVEAYSRLGYIIALTGDIRLGLEYLDRAIAGFDAERYGAQRFQVGNNAGVVSFNISALLLWMHGFPEQARQRAASGLELASRLHHPYSLAYATFHTGLLHLWLEETLPAQKCSLAVLEIARQHDYQVWEAVATCLHGATLARQGRAEEGLAEVRAGIAMYQGLKTPPVFWPELICMEAEICGMAGRPAEGLARLARLFEIFGHEEQNLMAVEAIRLMGELKLAQAGGQTEEISIEAAKEVEGYFLLALQITRQDSVPMLELRVALRLSAFWKGQGRIEEGRQVVRQAYEKIREGFEIEEMRLAREVVG